MYQQVSLKTVYSAPNKILRLSSTFTPVIRRPNCLANYRAEYATLLTLQRLYPHTIIHFHSENQLHWTAAIGTPGDLELPLKKHSIYKYLSTGTWDCHNTNTQYFWHWGLLLHDTWIVYHKLPQLRLWCSIYDKLGLRVVILACLIAKRYWMHNAGSPHQDISQTCSRINYSTRQVAWEWLSKPHIWCRVT